MDKAVITRFLISRIEDFCEENDIELTELDSGTRLMGTNGLFDSLDLVNFIVETEEGLEEEFGVEVTLTDAKAMSRRTSPFINAETLTRFILEVVNNE